MTSENIIETELTLKRGKDFIILPVYQREGCVNRKCEANNRI